MDRKDMKVCLSFLLFLALMFGAILSQGSSVVVGSVAGRANVTVSGVPVLPNTTLFSGDSLKTNDGVAAVALGQGSRLAFGPQTEASFTRDPQGVTVVLGRGNVSFYHPLTDMALRVKAEDVAILPAGHFKTMGEVASLNGALQVTAREGSLRVEGPERAIDVAKGKTITIVRQKAAATHPGAGGAAASHVAGLGKGLIVTSVGAAGTGAALKAKNPIAVEHVAAHVPDAACQHAASPSVPAQACAGR